ncbi:hypothetical protein BDZ89DRAFT_1128332 [Hymenopellis radicata]|nr:hypothetical protein BDZ89DRAFT_1128332 [Hymenopellis radicata]
MSSASRPPVVFAVLSHSKSNIPGGVHMRVFIQKESSHSVAPPLPAAIAVTTNAEAKHIVAITQAFCEENKDVTDGEHFHRLMQECGVMSNLHAFFRGFQGIGPFWRERRLPYISASMSLFLDYVLGIDCGLREAVRYSLAQSKQSFRQAYLYDDSPGIKSLVFILAFPVTLIVEHSELDNVDSDHHGYQHLEEGQPSAANWGRKPIHAGCSAPFVVVTRVGQADLRSIISVFIATEKAQKRGLHQKSSFETHSGQAKDEKRAKDSDSGSEADPA